ncbi:hypothetical protein EHM69_10860 [candidate division KSB1 bacterium]|nr:MAG: hypothetical protein EHM69_10860 [candidate division KSB1 bacterium]
MARSNRFEIMLPVLFTIFSISSTAYADTTAAALQFSFPLVDHPVYAYLKRLETTGDIALQSGTRPYLGFMHHPIRLEGDTFFDREFQRYRDEAAANMAVVNQDESSRESGWRKLRAKAGIPSDRMPWLYRTGFHLASWQYDSTFSAAIQPVYGLETIRTDDERGTVLRFTSGLRVEGGYAQRLHFMVDFRDHTEAGNGPYWTRDRLYEDRWAAVDLKGGKTTSYDISESFLQYYGRDLSLSAGRGRHHWGPAQFGSLFLNSRMPPFDYLRFDGTLESSREQAVYYTFLHGWLQSSVPAETLYTNPGGRPRTLNSQKYLSAQRLELRPRTNLLFGFSQGVVYGDRGVQLSYLTPLSFLYSVQHANEDKDNMLLGFDAAWRPARGIRIYGEFLFDDIIVSRLTTSSGDNKHAYTLGVNAAGTQRFWRHFDWTANYTRVRPFVYSHIFATNVYSHWTSPIGYTLQPNSDYLASELRGTYYPFQFTFHVSRQNHGENTAERNVGGDIYAPLYDARKTGIYPFLDGRLVRTTHIGLRIHWELLPGLRLDASGTHIQTTGADHRVEICGGFGWNL